MLLFQRHARAHTHILTHTHTHTYTLWFKLQTRVTNSSTSAMYSISSPRTRNEKPTSEIERVRLCTGRGRNRNEKSSTYSVDRRRHGRSRHYNTTTLLFHHSTAIQIRSDTGGKTTGIRGIAPLTIRTVPSSSNFFVVVFTRARETRASRGESSPFTRLRNRTRHERWKSR